MHTTLHKTIVRALRLLPAAGLLLSPVLVTPVDAQFITQNNGGQITITGYSGPGGAVTIPSTINGLPVVAINGQAFYGQSSFTSVVISNGLTSIGAYAFYSCVNMAGLTLPNSLTNLGVNAFADCTSLTSVTIPSGVKTIGDSPFLYCSGLTAINVASSNTAYSSAGGILFDKPQATLIEAPESFSGSYAVPNPVTSIGDNAFYGCSNLTGITLSSNVANIQSSAFANCGGLTTFNLPGAVTNIGSSAFFGCSNLAIITVATNNPAFASQGGVLFDHSKATLLLYPPATNTTSYTIPNTVTGVAQNAFGYCDNLTNVAIPGNVVDIEDGAFEYCLNLEAISVPNSVTNLGDMAFYNCTGLRTAAVGNGVTSFGLAVFMNCTSLAGVTLGNAVTNLGSETFSQCQSLTSFTMPNTVTYVGFEAFASCYNLQNLTLSSNLTTIGDSCLEVSGISTLAIPASVTSIGDTVFSGCQSLTAITVAPNNPAYSSVNGVLFDKSQTTLIRYPAGMTAAAYAVPNGVTDIADGAFSQCYSLQNVTFPDTLQSIGQFSFAACYGLTSLTLPSSVNNLSEFAFSICYSLSSVYCYGNAPNATPQSFSQDNLTVYYLPGTLGWGPTLGNEPTAVWSLPYPLILSGGPDFGVMNNRFGFMISWAADLPVVVQASSNLSQPVWTSLATNTLTNGFSYFSDLTWTNAPYRFYRLMGQ
jgi:BspA type Leucine rich repeat region (6 copies)